MMFGWSQPPFGWHAPVFMSPSLTDHAALGGPSSMPHRRLLATLVAAVLVVGLPSLAGSAAHATDVVTDPAATATADPAVPATPADPTVQPADPAVAAVPAAPLVLGSRTLRLGDVGEDVAALQKLLKVEADRDLRRRDPQGRQEGAACCRDQGQRWWSRPRR